jgi:hypothetical protein
VTIGGNAEKGRGVSLGSWVVARWAGLPPAHTYKVGVERDLRILMQDGVELLADCYFSRDDEKPPIILLRSPYGRRQVAAAIGRIFGARGFQSVVQAHGAPSAPAANSNPFDMKPRTVGPRWIGSPPNRGSVEARRSLRTSDGA